MTGEDFEIREGRHGSMKITAPPRVAGVGIDVPETYDDTELELEGVTFDGEAPFVELSFSQGDLEVGMWFEAETAERLRDDLDTILEKIREGDHE